MKRGKKVNKKFKKQCKKNKIIYLFNVNLKIIYVFIFSGIINIQ